MTFGRSELQDLAKKFGLEVPCQIEIDNFTTYAKNNPEREFISDTTFFRMLGAEIDAMDCSDFEGANIIADLNAEIPPNLCGAFDLIVNGSVLDNIWDMAGALRNIGALVAPHGRILSIESASSNRYAYSALSPSWYFDHFVVNGWKDCKLYIAAVENWAQVTDGNWPVMGFDPNAQESPNAFSPSIGEKLGICLFVAEKNEASTSDKSPIQVYYRSPEDQQLFDKLARSFVSSARPLYLGFAASEPIAGHDNAWINCGRWGPPSTGSRIRALFSLPRSFARRIPFARRLVRSLRSLRAS